MSKGWTLEQHKNNGAILKKMYIDSMTLLMETSEGYGKSSRFAKLARRLYDVVISLKSEGENAMYHDYPDTHDAISNYFNIRGKS